MNQYSHSFFRFFNKTELQAVFKSKYCKSGVCGLLAHRKEAFKGSYLCGKRRKSWLRTCRRSKSHVCGGLKERQFLWNHRHVAKCKRTTYLFNLIFQCTFASKTRKQIKTPKNSIPENSKINHSRSINYCEIQYFLMLGCTVCTYLGPLLQYLLL